MTKILRSLSFVFGSAFFSTCVAPTPVEPTAATASTSIETRSAVTEVTASRSEVGVAAQASEAQRTASNAGPAAAPAAPTREVEFAPATSSADTKPAPVASSTEAKPAFVASNADTQPAPGAASAEPATAPSASSAGTGAAPTASSTETAPARAATSATPVSATQDVSANAPRAPRRLRLEYLENPMGVGEPKPRFSWELDDPRRGATQSAYELVVASDRAALEAGRADVWSPGRVSSSATNQIEYGGPALAFDHEYWWRVRSFDAAGAASPWSAPATWTMGPLVTSDWRGTWIADPRPIEKGAPKHHGWRSSWKSAQDDMVWVQLDFGQQRTFDTVKLYPAHPNDDPKAGAGYLFPIQYRMWIADEPTFMKKSPIHIVDETAFDVKNPGDVPKVHDLGSRMSVRYVRFGFLKHAQSEGQGFGVALAEIELLDRGVVTSRGAAITSNDSVESDGWGLTKLIDGDTQSHAAREVPLPPAPHLRGEFALSTDVKRATAYVTALGLYELHVNGSVVGDRVLAPEWTRYDGHVQYQAYDVTSLVRKGNNAAGLVLGDGWYAGRIGLADTLPGFPRRGLYGDKPLALLQVEIELVNGDRSRFTTGPAWKSTLEGPIRSSDLLDGETYDARRALAGWDQPGFDDAAWVPVEAVGQPDDGIYWQPSEPMRVVEELPARSITEPAKGTYVVDFGRVVTGRCRITCSGAAGETVVLRHGEMLDAEGRLYTANLRGAAQTDRYTLRGGGRETWEPRFTLHGFRYVELTGLAAKPELANFVARVVRTSARETASFACSEPVLDALWRNARTSLAGNLTGIATDCPQRDERLGWMGDLGAFAQTGIYQMDLAAFLGKWAWDARDAQGREGRFPDFAPHPFGPGERFTGAPGWGDAGVHVPWAAWVNYGDKRLLERHVQALQRHVDFVMNFNRQFRWENQRGNDYGDWLNGSTIVADGWKREGCEMDKEAFATAWLRASTRLASKITLLVNGNETPTAMYQGAPAAIPTTYGDYSVSAANAFAQRYFDVDSRFVGGAQAGYVLALAFDLVPEFQRPKLVEHLLADIRARDNQLTTGFLTTHRALIELSRAGVAADGIACETRFPALGWQVGQGATTTWERRDGFVPGRGFADPGMNSFNHFAFGSIGEWMMGWLVGLRPDEKQVGWKHFVVAPAPTQKVTHAEGAYDSIVGRIEASWTKTQAAFELDVLVPANASATVVLPAADGVAITEGGQPIPADSKDARRGPQGRQGRARGARGPLPLPRRRVRPLAAAALLAMAGAFDASCASVRAPEPVVARVSGGRVHVIRAASGATVVLELTASDFQAPDAEFVRWTERAVAAIEAYYGRFPVDDARVTVTSRPGRRVVFGQADGDGVRVLVGRDVTRAVLDRDWTLTHEMVHLALPSLASAHHWLEEGSATYVEPIARALAGQRRAEDVWGEFARDYAQGLPQDGDEGLDRTPTWGRTYYGGALWCLLADVELRKATGNRVGLQEALAAVVARGGDARASWSIERVLAEADGAAGGSTLRDLYAAHATRAVAVDLAALWRELGVVRRGRGREVEFDEAAPLAAIRRAIVPVRGE
ncbi:MAG: family 78 glycoside hydrolase catalytic domain [Planctomycetes bacterium]|nr:family 78 glycoside hydrolase catalytic domain [Planctomycetota bacterium]